MGILADLFQKLTFRRRREELSPARIDELRTAFKDRYHSFKVLLAANNKALEIMAEMEEALRGARPFGMSFVRADCTAVSVNVFRIVKNLDQLAPGKYEELFDRFKEIQGRINEVLSRRRLPNKRRATRAITAPATTWSRTLKAAPAACAISTRFSGSPAATLAPLRSMKW